MAGETRSRTPDASVLTRPVAPEELAPLDADEVLRRVYGDLQMSGERVEAGPSRSVGADKTYVELRNHQVQLLNPLARLPHVDAAPAPFSVMLAVARFIWMMSGSDRLEAIAYYTKSVRRFSDDGVTIPGSSYGHRLLYSRPGLDQIEGVISTLLADRSSRRATAVIYQPEDAVRDSGDIPCALATHYAIRGDKLHATTVMRSNNAWTLLPFNVFEFTMLAEVVAARVGVPIGGYTHHSLSMHLYDENDGDAQKAFTRSRKGSARPMPAIPAQNCKDQLRRLIDFEAEVRQEYLRIDGNSVRSYLKRVRGEFNEYWQSFAGVLLAHALHRNGRLKAGGRVLEVIQEPMRLHVESRIQEQLKLPD